MHQLFKQLCFVFVLVHQAAFDTMSSFYMKVKINQIRFKNRSITSQPVWRLLLTSNYNKEKFVFSMCMKYS